MRCALGLAPLLVAGIVVSLVMGVVGCKQKQEVEEAGAPVDVDTAAAPMEKEGPEAPVETPPAGGGDEVALGTQVFEANCMTCHGQSGAGDGPASTGLQPPPANFADAEWKYGGDLASVKKTINEGVAGTAMIAWKGTLTDAEIEAVAKHVIGFSQGQ